MEIRSQKQRRKKDPEMSRSQRRFQKENSPGKTAKKYIEKFAPQLK